VQRKIRLSTRIRERKYISGLRVSGKRGLFTYRPNKKKESTKRRWDVTQNRFTTKKASNYEGGNNLRIKSHPRKKLQIKAKTVRSQKGWG